MKPLSHREIDQLEHKGWERRILHRAADEVSYHRKREKDLQAALLDCQQKLRWPLQTAIDAVQEAYGESEYLDQKAAMVVTRALYKAFRANNDPGAAK